MSSRRTCPACSQPFTKGVRVLFQARTGSRPATVCKRCARQGTIVVADKTGDLTRCTSCEKRPACYCSVCAVPRGTFITRHDGRA